jgi:hypothetical protein
MRKKIHKSHAILVEKQVINHNVNSKNNIQNLRWSNFRSVFMSVVIGNLKLAISVSCSCFQPRGFPNGILRDEGHITTWIVTLGWKVTLIYKVQICLNNCPRNCGHKFDEEQQCQKTSTVHIATDSSGRSSRFFLFYDAWMSAKNRSR